MTGSLGLEPHRERPGALPSAAGQPDQKPQPKPEAKTTKTRQPKVAPLPAIVKVCGYEITIPNTKTCWRANVVHSCGHPVMKISQARYPGCDRPITAEVNRHMRPCTEKCKVEAICHTVDGLCSTCMCRQLKDNEDQQTSSIGDGVADGLEIAWNGLPQL